MFRNAITLTLILLLGFSPLLAQQETATVFGSVKESNGNSIPGAQVFYDFNGALDGTTSNSNGTYKLRVPANVTIILVSNSVGFKADTAIINLKPNETFEANFWMKAGLNLPIVVIKPRDDVKKDDDRVIPGQVTISAKGAYEIPSPIGDDIGALVKSKANVASSNELSGTYSVRGGNYDENLVYVNGFEVYRPFLIRSGQQEGLSFANPHMADSLIFSAGGFQAKYGDKMSSVLSVWYKQPDSLAGSIGIGLLGGSGHLEGAIRNKQGVKKFTFLTGVRYKSNQYILKSLETQGQYNPSFLDLQGYFTYTFTKKLRLEWISNYARNRFSFKPVDRETTFGVVNQVLRLNIYFDGQESDSYETFMNGLVLVHKPKPGLELRWMTSAYVSQENERFDILGEYFIGEVENDLGDEDFGQVRYSLGVGGLQNFARNQLNWMVTTAEHQGSSQKGSHTIEWGLKYQRETINDKINEWERVDSAGYSVPHTGDEVLIDYVLKSTFEMNSNRVSGYIMDTWMIDAEKAFRFNYGARITYWDVNKEVVVSPRAQISFRPKLKKSKTREIILTAASGLYAQPPFYREMRNLDGFVNKDLLAQKSVHALFGLNYGFKVFKRDFRFVTEIYYKYLYDLVPYEFDNVLIRYTGRNNSTGYVAGIDLRLTGELVEDAESFISMSVLSTAENIQGDFYDVYLDAEGNQVQANSEDAVSSERRYPGNIPRPTDQRVIFNMYFQDYLPKNKNFKMHLNLVFASGLPFGPPDNDRYRDTLRIPPYRRVDIGFSAQLYNRDRRIKNKNYTPRGFGGAFENIWATLEVYNLLGINNTISYLWVKDLYNTTYAVPNYLTARLINFRVVFRFS